MFLFIFVDRWPIPGEGGHWGQLREYKDEVETLDEFATILGRFLYDLIRWSEDEQSLASCLQGSR